MYYDKIRHRNNQVLAATGLTTVEFDALLTTFKYHWDEYYSHFTLEGKVRHPAALAGNAVHPLLVVELSHQLNDQVALLRKRPVRALQHVPAQLAARLL